jgi:cell division septum initiation protein DivIVA
MPLLDDFLLRFRRVWAPPGPAAGQAAVPADLEARVDDELSELTSALNAIDGEGKSIVQAAEAEAAKVLAAAQSEADRLIETARGKLPEVRASRATARISDRKTERDQLIASAEKQAVDLRDRAMTRMQSFAGRVVGDVFEQVAGSVKEEHARVVGGR